MSFNQRQQRNLRSIIKTNAKASLFAHLGLDALNRFKDFNLLYQSFTRATPITGWGNWLKTLRNMSKQGTTNPANLILIPNMVTTTQILGLASLHGNPVPIGEALAKDVNALEKQIIQTLKSQGVSTNGYIFRLFDYFPNNMESIEQLSWAEKPFWEKLKSSQSIEGVKDAGRSKLQIMQYFYEQLNSMGDKVEILTADPAFITQFSMFIAQQRGKFTPLIEICPNLKVYCPIAEILEPYRTELAYFFRGYKNLKWLRIIKNPAGVMAYQADVNISQRMEILPSTSSFYEFIPAEDIDSSGNLYRSFRRLSSSQVDIGRSYLLLITNPHGLVAYNTRWIVKVVQLDPLQLIWERSINLLNHFGEAVSASTTSQIIDGVNSALASHGLFIREYMLGANVEAKQHNWVVEISRPTAGIDKKVFLTIARRIHSELEMKEQTYRQAFTQGAIILPQISFVPMGTFASMPDTFTNNHLDHTPDIFNLKSLLKMATNQTITITADDLV